MAHASYIYRNLNPVLNDLLGNLAGPLFQCRGFVPMATWKYEW